MSFKVSHQAETIQQEHSNPEPILTGESKGHISRTRKGTRKGTGRILVSVQASIFKMKLAPVISHWLQASEGRMQQAQRTTN